MTIKEFCQIYKLDESGVYKKIKRKERKLDGHITILNGTMQLDDEAIEILKPTFFAQMIEMENEIVKRENELSLLKINNSVKIEEYAKLINDVNEDMANSIKLLGEMSGKLAQAEREKAELEEKYNAALDRISELEKQLDSSNGKKGGIFGWKS